MPNNASARRGKDKKNKDKKKKDDQRTDTLTFPKENKAGMDSGTLSLSSAGKDKATKDSSSPSLSPEEKWEQSFFSALDKMEKGIQESAAGEIDWEKADWTWAKTNLLHQFYGGTTREERKIMRTKIRKEQEGSVGEAELKNQLDEAMLMNALQWRRNVHQMKTSSRVGLDNSSKDKASPLSLAGTKGVASIAAPKRAETAAEQALLLQFACSLYCQYTSSTVTF